MKALWNGVVLAESDDTVKVEGNHYFPADSLDRDVVPSEGEEWQRPMRAGLLRYLLGR